MSERSCIINSLKYTFFKFYTLLLVDGSDESVRCGTSRRLLLFGERGSAAYLFLQHDLKINFNASWHCSIGIRAIGESTQGDSSSLWYT